MSNQDAAKASPCPTACEVQCSAAMRIAAPARNPSYLFPKPGWRCDLGLVAKKMSWHFDNVRLPCLAGSDRLTILVDIGGGYFGSRKTQLLYSTKVGRQVIINHEI